MRFIMVVWIKFKINVMLIALDKLLINVGLIPRFKTLDFVNIQLIMNIPILIKNGLKSISIIYMLAMGFVQTLYKEMQKLTKKGLEIVYYLKVINL